MESGAGRGVREGVEVRKIHIVYFLCRNGKTEQPHLIRVHHLNRNGVHLRDVKRWLSELRGREMPGSFSWSYKRSYKAGYIWQDLVDGDLITPFSDNEYVLKGSILPSVLDKIVEDLRPIQERNISTDRKQNIVLEEEEEKEEEETYMPKSNAMHETLQIDDNISPKPPPSGDESPVKPATSPSIFDDNRNHANIFKANRWKEGRCGNEVVIEKSGSKGDRRASKGRSEAGHPRRAANFIKNILRCKIVEAKDSAENASPEQSMSMSRSNQKGSNNNNERKCWEKKGSRGSRKMTERAAATATYKPATEPNCSYCGKPFKPEKLHSHMMSCTALKEKGKRLNFTGDEQTAKTAATDAAASVAGIRRPSKVTVTVL